MIQPLVSIIIPVFNVEDYLDRCLNCVVEQSYQNLEIILVDDGSTDSSGTLCDVWARNDDRVRVIHKFNAGAGLARNDGIEIANGKYIFFFDSDDFVDLQIVDKCVTAAEKDCADSVFYGRFNAYENGSAVPTAVTAKREVYSDTQIQEELLPGLFTYAHGLGIGSWGRMYCRDIIDAHNIRFLSERVMTSEDAFFVLNYFAWAKKAVVLKESLYYYFNHSCSLSHSFDSSRLDKNNNFLEICLSFCSEAGLPEKVSSHVKARYHLYVLALFKQILTSSAAPAEKCKLLRKAFRDPVLHRTLTPDVLTLKNSFLRLFFTLLRYRLYPVCHFMLKVKLLKDEKRRSGGMG